MILLFQESKFRASMGPKTSRAWKAGKRMYPKCFGRRAAGWASSRGSENVAWKNDGSWLGERLKMLKKELSLLSAAVAAGNI